MTPTATANNRQGPTVRINARQTEWLHHIDANHPDANQARCSSVAALIRRGLVMVTPTGRLYPTKAGQEVIDATAVAK